MMTSYKVMVDYSMSLEDMIAAGNYDEVNGTYKMFLAGRSIRGVDHWENFHPQREKKGMEEVEVFLVHLDEYLWFHLIETELERLGLKSATFVELLALGAAHPELQREFPIVSLASLQTGPGAHHRPTLEKNSFNGERVLDLYFRHHNDKWQKDWRFLAVRKEVSA